MPLQHFFDPLRFGSEFAYTVVIVFLCFLIYYKTKEVYDLTKHKGIHYFRNTFLFFGLSYVSRFILHLLLIAGRTLDIYIPRKFFLPIIMMPVGYLSTMAIFYLTYSTIWKKVNYKHFIAFSNTIAILVSVIALITRSIIIVSILQLLLVAFTLILSAKKYKKVKKTHIRGLYLLISIFWLINLFVLGPKRVIPFELKVVFQIISIIVFIVIYHKVTKWTK